VTVEGRLYLRLLTRNWIPMTVILVVSIVLGGLSYLVSVPTYESTLSFVVRLDTTAAAPSEIYQAELVAQTRARLYARLATEPAMAAAVSDRLDGDPTAAAIQRAVTASVPGNSTLINISVQDRSTTATNSVAGAISDELPRYAATLQSSQESPATTVQLIAPPTGARRIAPSLTGRLGLGLLGGLLLAFLVAIIRETTNRRVRDVDDIRAVVGPVPVCADLRDSRGWRRSNPDEALVPLSVLFSAAAVEERPLTLVPVTPGPAAADAVLELAARLSMHGGRVALVDADVHGRHLTSAAAGSRPTSHGPAARHAAAQRRDPSPVEVIDADVVAAMAEGGDPGSADRMVAEKLGAAVLKAVSEVSERADTVLIVTGPVLLRSRLPFLPGQTAQVIVLTEAMRDTKQDLRAAVEVVRRLGSEVGAVVLDGRRPRTRSG
jgi:succinoglycan biosynthesis transport protein ExoP